MNDDLSARLRLGDPAALEDAMDRYASYAAKIIAAYLRAAHCRRRIWRRSSPTYSSTCGTAGSGWREK
ncbi:hypothetical protein [Oscillibacter sp.]|uniref:hypothetical protein n=1 Tax=Oscillibacter sp. TaxID=1945593 RepID=UPI001B736E58|nr:hypothetical protein [Oscillibacter sp.]MBP3509535.1 hypothetical protein [Oscillibacter sp.]